MYTHVLTCRHTMRPEHAHLDKGRAHMSTKRKPWEGGGYEWQLGEHPHSYCTSPVHKLHNAVSYNMCTCTLYNMVTCLLQSLDQSTTDNYQLLILKHCIISPVNTHTSIVHTHGGSPTVTCSRGQSLSPSAWSNGRGLMP